jgi:sigma-B regulation protein RsbU (phosphoserine phosphatase)
MLYGQGTVRLSENDLLLLYTDGASEAMNAEEKQFGEERMLKFLEDVGPRAAQEILENLEAELIAYRGLPSFEDDLTLVVVRVTGTKVEP